MTDQTTYPGVLGEIAEIAGEAAAVKVVQAKGGTKAYFPARPGPTCWLTVAVGQETAEKICAAVVAGTRGVELPVPLGPLGTRAKTWHVIQKALANGAAGPEAARLAGVDERTVRRHRNGHSGTGPQKDDRQGSLF